MLSYSSRRIPTSWTDLCVLSCGNRPDSRTHWEGLHARAASNRPHLHRPMSSDGALTLCILPAILLLYCPQTYAAKGAAAAEAAVAELNGGIFNSAGGSGGGNPAPAPGPAAAPVPAQAPTPTPTRSAPAPKSEPEPPQRPVPQQRGGGLFGGFLGLFGR